VVNREIKGVTFDLNPVVSSLGAIWCSLWMREY